MRQTPHDRHFDFAMPKIDARLCPPCGVILTDDKTNRNGQHFDFFRAVILFRE
jgi:hypothetical protein